MHPYPYSYPIEAYFHPSAGPPRIVPLPPPPSFIDTPGLRVRQTALLETLTHNTLYVIPSLVPYDDFAWYLYLHETHTEGIKSFGIQSNGTWYLTAKKTDNVFEIPWICMFIKIGTIADDRMDDFIDMMRYYRDNSRLLEGPRSFDWCFQTIDLLSESLIVICSDIERLQNKCLADAQRVVAGIAQGEMCTVITAEQIGLYPPRYAVWPHV